MFTTYLVFNGNCAEAMRFYERTLGGKLDLMTHAQSPVADQIPPGHGDKVMHSLLVTDQGKLGGMDAPGAQPYGGMNGFSLSLDYPTAADAKPIFEALAKGGTVTMPLQETFWADTFGMLVDRFGTPWMIGSTKASYR